MFELIGLPSPNKDSPTPCLYFLILLTPQGAAAFGRGPALEYMGMGKINRDAYKAGKPPVGFPKWPYKNIHLRENVIVNNVQLQIDQLHRQTLRQIYVPPQPSRVNANIDEEEEEVDQNGPLVPNNQRPYQGSSSSDSD